MEAFSYASILVLTSDPTNLDEMLEGKKKEFCHNKKFQFSKTLCSFKTYLEIILIGGKKKS